MDKKLIRIIIMGILLVFTFLFTLNIKSSVSGNAINEHDIKNLHEVSLEIKGMNCESCAYGVKAQLEELDGVVSANIDYKSSSGIVKYDSNKINAQSIAAASTIYSAKIIEDKKI